MTLALPLGAVLDRVARSAVEATAATDRLIAVWIPRTARLGAGAGSGGRRGSGDAAMLILATALCEAGVPRLARLNTAVVTVEGWVNLATGALVFEGRALAPIGTGTGIGVPAPS